MTTTNIMTTVEVATPKYIRPALKEIDLANVERLMKKTPVMLTDAASIKVQIENARLVKLVAELREKRNLTPLKDDDDFNKCWDAIEAAITLNNSRDALRFVLRENIRLTMEVHEHQRALHLPLMKVHKVR
jgi:hypothetical protein